MGQIALLLFILFCLYALLMDSKIHPRNSLALWIPTLWAIRCATRDINFWFNPYQLKFAGDPGDLLIYGLDRNFIMILMLLGLIVLIKRAYLIGNIIKYNFPLVIFLLIAGLSIFWSEIPDTSLFRYIRIIGDFEMALVLASEKEVLDALKRVLRRTTLFLIPLSVILVKYFRDFGTLWPKHIGESNMWIGVTTHKNALGQLLLVSAFLIIWELSPKPSKFKIPALLCVPCVIFLFLGGGRSESISMTSLLITLLGIFFYFFMENLNSLKKTIKIIIVSAGTLITFNIIGSFILGSQIMSFFLKLLGKDPTLAGRTDLWPDVFSLALDHFLAGPGFAVFWTGQRIADLHIKYTWGPEQAHNGYLEIFAQLGIIGIILLLITMRKLFLNIDKSNILNNPDKKMLFILFLAVVLINLTEACFARGHNLMWFLFLLLVTVSSRLVFDKRTQS